MPADRQVGNETQLVRSTGNTSSGAVDLAALTSRAGAIPIPSLTAARREFHKPTGDSRSRPYEWVDLVQHLNHRTLINSSPRTALRVDHHARPWKQS